MATAAADVGDEPSLRAAMGALRSELGPATVLVYNGSAYVEGAPTALSVDQLRLALDVGVVGALVATQEAVPAMRAAGRGTIVLTGSVAADRASTSAAAVGVAKAALRNLAHVAAQGAGTRRGASGHRHDRRRPQRAEGTGRRPDRGALLAAALG